MPRLSPFPRCMPHARVSHKSQSLDLGEHGVYSFSASMGADRTGKEGMAMAHPTPFSSLQKGLVKRQQGAGCPILMGGIEFWASPW